MTAANTLVSSCCLYRCLLRTLANVWQVTCWTIFVINFVVVMLRILVRVRRRKQSLAIGDYLVLAALFSSLLGYALFTRGLNNQIVFQNMTTGANSSIQGGGEQSRRLLAAGLPVLQQALKVRYHLDLVVIYMLTMETGIVYFGVLLPVHAMAGQGRVHPVLLRDLPVYQEVAARGAVDHDAVDSIRVHRDVFHDAFLVPSSESQLVLPHPAGYILPQHADRPKKKTGTRSSSVIRRPK